jgi:hypothetical protein
MKAHTYCICLQFSFVICDLTGNAVSKIGYLLLTVIKNCRKVTLAQIQFCVGISLRGKTEGGDVSELVNVVSLYSCRVQILVS